MIYRLRDLCWIRYDAYHAGCSETDSQLSTLSPWASAPPFAASGSVPPPGTSSPTAVGYTTDQRIVKGEEDVV